MNHLKSAIAKLSIQSNIQDPDPTCACIGDQCGRYYQCCGRLQKELDDKIMTNPNPELQKAMKELEKSLLMIKDLMLPNSSIVNKE